MGSVLSLRLHPFAFPEKTIVGTQVSATCTTVEAAQNVRFRWFKNGRLLTGSERDGRIRLRTFPDVSNLVIGPLEESDSGNYTCTGTAGLKSDSYTQTLHVLVPPRWVKEPSDISVREGDNVTLTCSASGRPSPAIKWKRKEEKGEAPVNSSHGGTLKISKTTKSVSGTYTCTADNGLPGLLVREIRVNVFVTGGITSGVEFSWYKDGKALTLDDRVKIRSFPDMSTLVVDSLRQDDSGNYTCMGRLGNRKDSHTANLRVLGSLQLQPFAFPSNAVIGNTVTVTCTTISRTANVNFQWLKDGKELVKSSKVEIVHHPLFSTLVIGPTTKKDSGNYTCIGNIARNKETTAPGKNELQIANASKLDAGSYECSADNEVLEAITKTITIAIYGFGKAVKVQPFSFPSNVVEGSRVSATCSLMSISEGTRFRWSRNGKPLSDDPEGRIKTRTEADFSMVTIGPVRQGDSGNYSCTAMSKGKSDTYSSNLVVYGSINVVPFYIPDKVMLGDTVKVVCYTSTEQTPLSFKWLKDGKLLVADENIRIKTQADLSTMILGPVKPAHRGNYTCQVFTPASSGSYTATLLVYVPARFEEKFKVQTVRRGEAATLQCQAIGDLPLEITWSQDKKRLIFAPVTRYEKFESNTENGVTAELLIPTTDRSDAALYTCVAKNEYGSDERNIKLLVVEVPAQPLDLRILEVWRRKVNVIWSEPYSGNSPINNYIVHYWRDRDGAHRLMEQTVPSGQTSAMISELHPGASYSLTVTAENEVGQGPPSDPVRFLTAEEEPGGSPTDVWAAAKGPTSIAVSWKPPPRDTWNGVLKGYYVGYRAAESSQPYSFKTVETVVNGSQEVTLVGLTKSSRYSVIVKAFNAIGSGPPSEALLVYTLDGDVPFPPALTLISSTDSAFKVKWTQSKATAAPVTGYTLHYKKNTGPWHHIPVVASGDTSYTLTDLDGGATYKVYLTASNQFGRGSGSEAIIINTTNQGHDRAWVFYKDPSLLVPAASFLIAVLVVITVVTICIKKTKAHKNFEKSLEAEKRQSYGEVTQQQQRYIDVTEKRNRSDYATIQSRRSLSGNYKIEELRSAAPNRGYNTTDAKDRRRSSLRKSSASSHVYDSAA
ncbi:cell adhesion molecule Dscam1-like [Dermacentor variabilis]|uniref:cell adhesion molecule Dscam1-like n=1 Tax=Dermacentor variabilis TaxID=34621 RepID=UPI003F5AEC2F